jgi:DNA-binding XRE family transcriptional regulator
LYEHDLYVEFRPLPRNALCVERDKNLVILGDRIRMLRKEKGLSQEKLAELSDVHRNFIGFIERGERNVGVRTIIALAQALDMPLSKLFENCDFEQVCASTEQ